MVTPAAAIAAEVAARYGVAVCPSVVQLCPPRTFSATLPVWDGQKLVYPDADARKLQHRKAIWAGAQRAGKKFGGSQPDPLVAARRADVARLHGEGKSLQAIADALSLTKATVQSDHQFCGLRANAFVTDAMTQAALRGAIVGRMHAEGASQAAVAAHLGVTLWTVRELAARYHGLKFTRQSAKLARVAGPAKAVKPARVAKPDGPPPTQMGVIVAQAVARRQLVLAMQSDGAQMAAIMHATGLSKCTVFRYLRQAGRTAGSGKAAVKIDEIKATIARRKDYVVAALARGETQRTIAAHLGITPRQVGRYRSEMGLAPLRVGRRSANGVAA